MSLESVPSWITEFLEDLTRLETTVSLDGVSVEGGHLVAQAQVGQTPDTLNDIVRTDGFITPITSLTSLSARYRKLDGTLGVPILTPNSDTRKFKVFGWELKSVVDTTVFIPPLVSSSDFSPSVNMVDGDFATFAEVISDNNDIRNSIIDFGSSASRPLFIKVKATNVIGSPITNVVTSTSTASGGPFTQIDTRPLTTGLEELFLLPSGVAFRFVKCELVSIDSLPFTVTQDQFEITTPDIPTITSSDWSAPEQAKMLDLDFDTFGRVTDTGTIVETTTVVDFGTSILRTPAAKLRANTLVGTSTHSFLLGVSNSSTGPFTISASGVLTNGVNLEVTGTVDTFRYMQLIISSTDSAPFTISHNIYQMWSNVFAPINPIVIGGNLIGPLIVDGDDDTFESLSLTGIGTKFFTTIVDFGSILFRTINLKFEFINDGGGTGTPTSPFYVVAVSNDDVSYTNIDIANAVFSIPKIITDLTATFRYLRLSTLVRIFEGGSETTNITFKNFQMQGGTESFTAATAVTSSDMPVGEQPKIIDSDLNTFAIRTDTGQGVIKTTVFDSGGISEKSIFAIIRMTHTVGSANNSFLFEKSDDDVSYTDVTSGVLISGVNQKITVAPQSFRYLRLSILCVGIVNFTVDDDIFELFTYTNNTVFSSEFTNSANIVDGDLNTFATSDVNNPTPSQETIINFGTSIPRQLQAKVNVKAILGTIASSTVELLTADSVAGPFISRVNLALVDDTDTIVDAGTHTFQFAKLILTSTDANTFQAQNKVFQIYDANKIQPFSSSLVSIGTSDDLDDVLTSTLWTKTLTGDQTILMPHEVVTLLKNKYLTMEVTQLQSGASITLEKIHTWDQNIAII